MKRPTTTDITNFLTHYFTKKNIVITLLILVLTTPITLYYLPVTLFNLYVGSQASKLIALDAKGELSKEKGYVWAEINANHRMANLGATTLNPLEALPADSTTNKAPAKGLLSYPSLEAMQILNGMDSLSNKILVLDRNGSTLGEINTTQNILHLAKFPPLLTNTLLLTEDQNYYHRKRAYEPSAFYRAALVSLMRSIKTFGKVSPRGTSTIHQQVARFLLSSFTEDGQIYIERSMNRKLREIILAEALKKEYGNDAMLELYMNHCVTAGQSMVGYNDISLGLFEKSPLELSDAQNLYLSRLVKWNRQVPTKIKRQVRVSMDRIAQENNWSSDKRDTVLADLDTLSFSRPPVIDTDHSHLLDLANEMWLKAARQKGMSEEEVQELDFSNPNSLIRQKGNLTIQLTIDIRLQELLEQQVDARGFGADTTIRTDVRIGSFGEDVPWSKKLPEDTMRKISLLESDSTFSDGGAVTTLEAGDTLITNTRYKSIKKGLIRKSQFYYKRAPLAVQGQYFSYVMIDANSGELLAYYSRDKLGSRLNSLLKNRVPNGSSLAKPLIYALNYDLSNFEQYAMASDAVEYGDSVSWARSYLIKGGDTTGMIYHNAKTLKEDTEGYPVRNHERSFEGYDYEFNHLARSNNIITVENFYKLNTALTGDTHQDKKESEGRRDNRSSTSGDKRSTMQSLLERIDAQDYLKKDRVSTVTGPRLYSEIVRLIYSDGTLEQSSTEEAQKESKTTPSYVSNSNYSYALGTLELSVYEQAHLFNSMYNNQIIKTPALHPSLILKKVVFTGTEFPLEDTLQRVALFNDINSIEPVKIALYKRFSSNGYDGMGRFSPCAVEGKRGRFAPAHYPLANYAKSGTTDDILRPYNSDPALKESTAYGLWSGTFDLTLKGKDLKAYLPKGTTLPRDEKMVVTLASVGEANRKNTGTPDGKSLHKYLSIALMKKYGRSGCGSEGYYQKREAQIIEDTPRKVRFFEVESADDSEDGFFSKLFKKAPRNSDEMFFKKRRRGVRIDKASLQTLEEFSTGIGEQSTLYQSTLITLEQARTKEEALEGLNSLAEITPSNRIIAEELSKAEAALRVSLEEM